jgi:hypothetical protein
LNLLSASAKVVIDCRQLVAGGIRIISTLGPAVIIWSCHCCTDGSGTQAHAHASAHICSPIGAASPRYTAAINSSAHCDAPAIYAASVSHGVCRNAREAKGGNYSNGNRNSK